MYFLKLLNQETQSQLMQHSSKRRRQKHQKEHEHKLFNIRTTTSMQLNKGAIWHRIVFDWGETAWKGGEERDFYKSFLFDSTFWR